MNDIGILPSNDVGGFGGLVSISPGSYSTALITILLGLSGVLSFIFLLWGGIQWITAGGDKDAVEKGRRKILQALIGLSIVFSSYAIIYIIRVLFQIEILQVPIRSLTDY